MGIRNQKIVILPPFRSAVLHQNVNPLPVNNIPAFGQDIERKSGLETFAFFLRQILRTPRFCLRTKSLRSLCKISSPKSQKTPACHAPTPQGRMIAREQGVPRPKVSTFRPRHNIIGPKLCNNPRASCGLITQFRLC